MPLALTVSTSVPGAYESLNPLAALAFVRASRSETTWQRGSAVMEPPGPSCRGGEVQRFTVGTEGGGTSSSEVFLLRRLFASFRSAPRCAPRTASSSRYNWTSPCQ